MTRLCSKSHLWAARREPDEGAEAESRRLRHRWAAGGPGRRARLGTNAPTAPSPAPRGPRDRALESPFPGARCVMARQVWALTAVPSRGATVPLRASHLYACYWCRRAGWEKSGHVHTSSAHGLEPGKCLWFASRIVVTDQDPFSGRPSQPALEAGSSVLHCPHNSVKVLLLF